MSDATNARGAESLPEASVVIAEDEALIRLDLAEMLTEMGYRVLEQVADGRAAVDAARAHRPQVVLMDVKMPVLDGISAAEEITRDGLAPVVLLTAFSDAELAARAADAGVLAYVLKPFSEADLRPALAVARARFDQMKSLSDEITDLTERFEARKAVDRAKGLLQSRLSIDEAQAFRWLQKTAMDRRLPMRDVARAVIEQMDS